MRIRMTYTGRKFVVPSLILVLLLAACAPRNADATPTLSVDAIFTAAAQTLRAQEATALALTPPTSTPSPSPFPTLPPPSPAATISFVSSTPPIGGGSQCDNATFVSDVTIPDGTTMKPGEKFTKTWRMYNSGTCNWTTSYKWVFVSGDALGGATTVLAAQVNSGSQTDISVALTAPTNNGTFKGYWRMQNANGVSFGNQPWVEIKVGAGSTVTPGPSPTAGPSPTGATSTSSSGQYNVSGNAGTGSALIDCIGAGNKPDFQVTSADSGAFTCVVPWNWDGEIRPSKGNWSFSPSSLAVPNVQADVGGFNFTATAP